MSDSIIRTLSREVTHAFIAGKFSAKAFGKVFKFEHVYGAQWRLTDESGNDIGLRWNVNAGKLSFFMA